MDANARPRRIVTESHVAHLTIPHKPKPPQPTKNKQDKERESQVHEVEVARAGRSLSPPKRDTNRGLLGGAPVARERWIGGWEAAALARRLLGGVHPGTWPSIRMHEERESVKTIARERKTKRAQWLRDPHSLNRGRYHGLRILLIPLIESKNEFIGSTATSDVHIWGCSGNRRHVAWPPV